MHVSNVQPPTSIVERVLAAVGYCSSALCCRLWNSLPAQDAVAHNCYRSATPDTQLLQNRDYTHNRQKGEQTAHACVIAPITLKIRRLAIGPCPIRGALPRLSAGSSSNYYCWRKLQCMAVSAKLIKSGTSRSGFPSALRTAPTPGRADFRFTQTVPIPRDCAGITS